MPQSRNNVLRIRKQSKIVCSWHFRTDHQLWSTQQNGGCPSHTTSPSAKDVKEMELFLTCVQDSKFRKCILLVGQIFRFQGRSAEALRSYGCSGVRATCSSKNGETTVTSMVLSWFCKGFFSFFTLGCDAAICIAATKLAESIAPQAGILNSLRFDFNPYYI